MPNNHIYLFKNMSFAFTRFARRALPVMLAMSVTNMVRIRSLSLIIQVLRSTIHLYSLLDLTMLLSMFLFSRKFQMTKVFPR
jgi:hypothetical protein